jgi:hypothetical protein
MDGIQEKMADTNKDLHKGSKEPKVDGSTSWAMFQQQFRTVADHIPDQCLE